MSENKFNKTKIRDYLEVVSNSNSGYIKSDGDITSKSNLIIGDYTLLNGIYTNIGGSIFIKKDGVSIELTRDDLINLKNIFTNGNLLNINLQSINSNASNDEILLNDTIRVNGSIFHKVSGNYINLSSDISTIKTNITNLQTSDTSQNSTLLNCAKLNSSNNFTGTNNFDILPTTSITTFNNSNQLVSKGYVDSAISGTSNISSSNFNWTGQHTYNSNLPTTTITNFNNSNQFVSKGYVDSVVSSGSSSLFSSNNNWSGFNSFPDIIVDGDSINQLFLDIGTTNQLQDTEINNIKQVSLPNLDNRIITNTNNITTNTNNITTINNNITTINNSINLINTKNNEQDSSISSINNSISSINTKNNEQDSSISSINSTLSNCAKINANNNFGNFTNTFNIINCNRIEKTNTGIEIYSESPFKFNTTEFYYKNGSGYDNLANKMNEKLNISNGTANNLTINNSFFTGSITGLSKSNVGLSNVDNTSDLNKPISTETQTQLNLKANIQSANLQNPTLNNPTFTGNTNFNKIYFNTLRNNYNWFNGNSSTPNLSISGTTANISIINSKFGSNIFQVNLNQLSSDEDGMIWMVRYLFNDDWRLSCGSGASLVDLDNNLITTNKLYQSKRSVSFMYYHSLRRYYILTEN